MQKYRTQIFFGIILTLAIYIGLLLFGDSQGYLNIDGIWEKIQDFPFYLIFVVVACQLLVILFRFIEWHYYLGVIDARDRISLLDSLIIFVASFTMVVSPGKGGELIKSVLLKMKTRRTNTDGHTVDGIPVAKSAPIILAERVVDGIAVIILMTITLLLAGDQLNLGIYDGSDYAEFSRLLILLPALLIITGLIIIQIRPLAYFFLNLLGYIPILKRLHDPLIQFYESSREIFALRHVIPMSLVGVCVYLASGAGFVTILYGFGLSITWQFVLQALFILGIASAIGALSLVPNGAGVTEISNMGMLLALVAPIQPIVTLPLAAAAALLQGFFHKWFRVILGLTVAVVFRKRLFGEGFAAEMAHIQQKS